MRALAPPLLACAALACGAGDHSAAPADTAPAWPDLQDLEFASFEPWARPIDDYIETNRDQLGHDDFLQGIHDLAVFEDRLYLGYGDANLNLGRITPIEVRAWTSLEPDGWQAEFTTDEEQISHYRLTADALVIPGVDATEDDLLGNVYSKAEGGAGWFKSRTLEYAWHVHDAAAVGSDLYACGSGGSYDDYENSTVNAFLYRSSDAGGSFVVHQQLPHPDPPGDNRFTQLLTVGEQLYVFGYRSDLSSINGFHAYALGDEGLSEVPDMPSFFTTAAHSLQPDVGLLVGVYLRAGDRTPNLLRPSSRDCGWSCSQRSRSTC